MCILTKLSESLNKKQKQGFFLAFALIAAISVLEVITIVVDGTPPGYRWLNICPTIWLRADTGGGAVPCICAGQKIRHPARVQGSGLLRGCVSAFSGGNTALWTVFSVSAENLYARGEYFYIYVVMYYVSMLYLTGGYGVARRRPFRTAAAR